MGGWRTRRLTGRPQYTIALRDDHACFLDQPEWQDIIRTKLPDSMIQEEWEDSYRCLPLTCLIPRLFHECRDIVRNKWSQTPDRINAFVAAVSLLRQSFLDMAEKYDWKPGRYSPLLAPRSAHDGWRVFCDKEDLRAANYGNFLSGLVVVNRMLFSVRPSAVHVEQDSRASALEIQYLHSFIKTEPRLNSMVMIHSERVALAIVLTSNHWSAERSSANGPAGDPKTPGGGNIIDVDKFNHFDAILCAKTIHAPLV